MTAVSPTPRRLRTALFAVMLAVAVLAVAGEAYYRRGEAHLGGWLVREIHGAWVWSDPDRPDFHFILDGNAMGLRISYGCSTSILVLPILLSSALCLRGGRGSVRQVLAATLAAVTVVFSANLLRLVVIAGFVGDWGAGAGFGWGHTVFGSVIVLGGVLIAYFLYVRILFRAAPEGTPEVEEKEATPVMSR
ncbi:MAG TPA: exosortase/archaeosortase family protein [Streptomyces sp.]